MAVAPPLPKLDPADMKWVRWITQRALDHEGSIGTVKTNVASAVQQASAAHAVSSTLIEKTAAQEAIYPSMPTDIPQVPSKPTLITDHGTVTIRWDGLVHTNISYVTETGDDNGSLVTPAIGFKNVTAERAMTANGPWTIIGGAMGHNGSIVDTNVAVGTTYWYHLITTDNLGVVSDPSEPASVTVQGVDLGTLDQDVKDALKDAADAAQAGIDAAAAGAAAAQAAKDAAASADGKAAQALLDAATAAGKANTAQTAADTANSNALAASGLAGGKGKVWYQTTAPAGNANDLWIDTTNNANTPKRWNGTTWVAVTDKAATDAASAAAAANTAAGVAKAAADAAQQTANTAVTNAATAQGTANTALTAANGKNKVIYSTAVASGTTGYISGDLWFQRDGNNVIIAQWQFSGTAWVSQTLSGTLVAAGINAGNITAGFINSARINAGTIAASQMITGTITAASGILADAVVTNAKIADLAVSTAKIADLAVNNAKINDLNGNKITAASIVAGKLAADSVVTNNIVAGAIDTNRIAAGAIDATKLSLTATPSLGTPVNRVPAPVTNSLFWNNVVNGGSVTAGNANSNYSYTQSSPQTWGLILTAGQRMSMTAKRVPMPKSRKLIISLAYTGPLNGIIDLYDANNVYLASATGVGPGTWGPSFPGLAAYYEYSLQNIGTGGDVATINECSVFEATGSDASVGQAAQLTPAGLQLFDVNGKLAVDLTTNAAQVFMVTDNSGVNPRTVAAIDQNGNAAFQEASAAQGFDIAGVPLTDLGSTTSLINSQPNGSSWSVGLLDRLPRGVIYDVRWASLDNFQSSAQYIRIAQDQFILEDGRTYMIVPNLGGLQLDATDVGDPRNIAAGSKVQLGVNCYVEMQLNTVPNVWIRGGAAIGRSVVFNNTRGYFNIQPIIVTATSAIPASYFAANSTAPTADDNAQNYLEAGLVPANTPIYWQVNFNMISPPARPLIVNEGSSRRGVTVIDMGSSNLMHPYGNESLTSATDRTTEANGSISGSTGSTTGGTTGTSRTVTIDASWSHSWSNNGANLVGGSGTNNDASKLYQGGSPNAGAMGAMIGFDQGQMNVFANRTVTNMQLYLKNQYAAKSAGFVAALGAHGSGDTTTFTTIGGGWNPSFSAGEGKWVTVPQGWWGNFANGQFKGFNLGINSDPNYFGYFAGANQAFSPRLKVTYH